MRSANKKRQAGSSGTSPLFDEMKFATAVCTLAVICASFAAADDTASVTVSTTIPTTTFDCEGTEIHDVRPLRTLLPPATIVTNISIYDVNGLLASTVPIHRSRSLWDSWLPFFFEKKMLATR
jgi:hypothetical protein